MKIIESPSEMQAYCRELRQKGIAIGFVPTMGFLHEGHLSLVRRAQSDNDIVIVSIFVNPTQFGPDEDLEKYPRNFERDISLLKSEGVELVFHPTASDMYPEKYATFVDVEHVTDRLCGLNRPGHFRGVATVVAKLFNIVGPCRSYFGQKDYQQTVVIKKMVNELQMDVKVMVCPTVREPDGLAVSSRNSYLAPNERRAATILIKALKVGKAEIFRLQLRGECEQGIPEVIAVMLSVLKNEPMAEVEYVEAADPDTLDQLKRISSKILLALAVRIGTTRLIDNLVVEV